LAEGAVVRPADAADLAAILAIVNDAILNTTAWYDYAPWDSAQLAQWFDGKRAAGWPVLVAIARDGTLAGFGSIGSFRGRAAYHKTGEHSVYVEKEHRGQGYGRLLLAAIIDAARGLGLHTLIGGVDSGNDASLAFHRALGFVEAGRMREVGWKFDRWLTLVFMQKML
jgi:phosphinothricin acetyltransferase